MTATGHLDSVADGRVVGWAWDPERPQRTVEVFVWLDDRFAGRALANRERTDLKAAAIGDGRHGFQFTGAIPPGTRTVRVTTAAGEDLRRSPFRLQAELLPPAAPDHDGITVLAIARDEAPYIEEWIAHHRAIGVDRFLIYDNASTDGTGDRLRRNPTLADLVEVVDWPSSRYAPTIGPQPAAYADALPALQRRGGWIVVIDIDEFVVPLADDSLPDLLARFREVPALSLCWKVFGSSGHVARDDDRLVQDRFRFAGRATLVKSIARAGAIQSIGCHAPLLTGGSPVDELRRPIANGSAAPSPSYRWGQINHYFAKSWAEWEAKRDRGRAGPAAGAPNWRRPDSHFAAMDHAHEYDLGIVRFRPRMLRVLADLFPDRAARARAAGRGSSRPGTRSAVPVPTRLHPETLRPSAGPVRGHFDVPARSAGPARLPAERPARVAGWLFDPAGRPGGRRTIRLRSADDAALDYLIAIEDDRPRADVARHFPGLPERITANSGFDVTIDLRAMPHGLYRARLGVRFADGAAWTTHDWTIRIG